MARTVTTTVAAVAATVVSLAVLAAPADATPPNIPSSSTARSRLNTLTVAAEFHQSSYDRDLFPHWTTISGTCNTREQFLQRDGTSVAVNAACYPTSGSWYSPYDGATWTNPTDVDIDHVVPLAEAWPSGAWAWTTARRQTYANGPGRTRAVDGHRQRQSGRRRPRPGHGNRRGRRSAAPTPAPGSRSSGTTACPSTPREVRAYQRARHLLTAPEP